ncbi:MAG TPA: glycosyltransferase family 2 protein [Terriglobia bacterium]|nr:glycosyltransferase family 2 protein [Terriglobia bacterium]
MENSSSKPRIAAVVVTYNRCALLDRCLEALTHQDRPLDAILVIDNASTDNTPDILKQKYQGKVTHIRLQENLGGSGGYYEGIRLAHEKGYEWIWVMDDDVEPAVDALKALANSPAFEDPSVGLLASLVLEARPPNQTSNYEHINSIMTASPHGVGWIPVGDGNYRRFSRTMGFLPAVSKASLESPAISIQAAGFLAVMIRNQAVSAVGLPLKELFIFWDDLEFTYRISRQFKMFLVPSSKVIHRHGVPIPSKSKFLGIAKKGSGIPTSHAWRLYYFIRNETFVRTKYSKPWIAPIIPVMLLIKSVGATILFYDHPLARCKVVCRAVFDGVFGRLGKRFAP